MFDVSVVVNHGWRQGSILGPELGRAARDHAPKGLAVHDDDILIVTSHDCDVANERLEKEPVVEVLRAVIFERKGPDKQQIWGRNPRLIQFEMGEGADALVLGAKVHERWSLPRELLASEAPARCLEDKTRRLIAEWLAKRYIRSAFPTAFDSRWRLKMKDWTGLLEKNSAWIQGVYLRLNTLLELADGEPYRCHLIVGAPAKVRIGVGWAAKRGEIERSVEAFWGQFEPGIRFDGVDVLGTDELTLADIDQYQRFDADWVSFADGTEVISVAAELASGR